MVPEEETKDPGVESILTKGPIATLLFVVATIVGAVTLIAGDTELTFESWLAASLLGAGALGIGRGLAYTDNDPHTESFLEKLDKIPWATVLVVIYALAGVVVLVVGETDLTYETLMTLVVGASVTLGIGRGIAKFKKDSANVNTYGNAEGIGHPDLDPTQPDSDEGAPTFDGEEPEPVEGGPEGDVKKFGGPR